MTRRGSEARIVCFDKQFQGEINMVVLLKDKLPSGNYNELIRNYKLDGTSIGKNRDYDLVMAPEKRVHYINIYRRSDNLPMFKTLYDTYDEAYNAAMNMQKLFPPFKYIKTIKIEWEE